MADPERLRLFFAVRVPDQHLRAVDVALGPLKDRLEGARWAPVENQHVTLKFLGSTTADRLSGIEAAATRAAMTPAGDVGLTTLGAFPSRKRARVLWVGIDDPDAVLTSLAKGLDRELLGLGFEPEARDYHPHLTVARFKAPRPLPEDVPEVTAGLEPFPVGEMVLFRSRLHPKGARYEVLEAFPLSG